MKNAILALTMFASSFAFAGTGQGNVSCNDGKQIVAVYSWFHSNADSYSEVTVFVQNDEDKYEQVQGSNENALAPILVKTKDGSKIEIKPDLKKSNCKISIR